MDTILLELTTIKGNSMIDQHADKIIVDSFSHSVSLPISSDAANTERTLGRPSFSEFQFSKVTDQSTPALYGACASGAKLGDANVLVGRNEAGVFMLHMKYVLSNAMVSHISTGGGGGMSDSFSLSFTMITAQYTQQKTTGDQQGTASFGWDLATNKDATPKT
ncbi:MAG TPA: type VI secretion system tube protein Hcp [Paraburkholderia sp.]|jgi:type VI secretion system secreted protein Hcp